MKMPQKIRAGALQFVVFIGAVIAVLLLAFVLVVHSHNLFIRQSGKAIDLIKQADWSLARALQAEPVSGQSSWNEMGPDGIAVQGERSIWGVFEKWTVQTRFRKDGFLRVALVGGQLPQNPPALFIQDLQRPVVLAGNARITGTAYLPEAGIRPGSVGGRSFLGPQLVNGETRHSDPEFPLAASFWERFAAFSELSNELNVPLAGTNESAIKRSFSEPTQIVSGAEIDLRGRELTGNVLVHASTRILVDASSRLTDVVLLAPVIDIGPATQGRFQAIATQRIEVGEGVVLAYPSALAVFNAEKLPEKPSPGGVPAIAIAGSSRIDGLVGYFSREQGTTYHPQIRFETGSMLRGQVWCQGNLELKGTVQGSVITRGFMALEGGGIFQNHLLDGQIEGDALPVSFVGLASEISTAKGVAQWLY